MTANDDTGGDKAFTGRQKSGKAGGEATKQKHGSDFFRMIGKKGGQAKGEKPKEKEEEPPPERKDEAEE